MTVSLRDTCLSISETQSSGGTHHEWQSTFLTTNQPLQKNSIFRIHHLRTGKNVKIKSLHDINVGLPQYT